jgi:hypothetical protein
MSGIHLYLYGVEDEQILALDSSGKDLNCWIKSVFMVCPNRLLKASWIDHFGAALRQL